MKLARSYSILAFFELSSFSSSSALSLTFAFGSSTGSPFAEEFSFEAVVDDSAAELEGLEEEAAVEGFFLTTPSRPSLFRLPLGFDDVVEELVVEAGFALPDGGEDCRGGEDAEVLVESRARGFGGDVSRV